MTAETAPATIYLKDYQQPPFLVDSVYLDFDLREAGSLVSATLKLRRNPRSAEARTDLFLHGEILELLEISLDGEELASDCYRITEEGMTLFSVPDDFELKTLTRIYPEKNTALEGLYRSSSMYCTQCEAEGFRKITWFPDRPDVLAKFTTRIEADRKHYPVLLGNGNLFDHGESDGGRHYAIWQDPWPKPCYLFALVAGDLHTISDSFITKSGSTVALNIYVEAENIAYCDHAMLSLKNAMKWDEDKYGREYDLSVYNIVAVNDFNMGAMENKGLNIFNSKYVLASPATATDRDFQGIESVIAHEYFHNWTGNRITCRDWFQLSLKEGFTVFRDQCFSGDMGSEAVNRIEDVRLLRAHQFAEDTSPMAHPVRPASYIEINNFYTVTVYEKGAEVVRMQANLLGPEQFRKATDLYFERFDGMAVTTEDFVQCMQDVSGIEFTQFKNWYDFAGTPELTVSGEYDADSKQYRLHVSQSCPDTPGQTDKPPFHIPFHVGLLDSSGNDLLDNGMLHVKQREQTFVFDNISEQPVPSLLRGFTAPVKVTYDYSDAELMFLMAHDSDGFARWDATQQLVQKILLSMIDQHNRNNSYSLPDGFIAAFCDSLLDTQTDPALLAEVLTLPSESYLGDQMAVVDVDGIHAARTGLKKQLANALYDELLQVYNKLNQSTAYRVDASSIARRSLKNTVLGYLVCADNDQARQLCLEQYHAQHNMTDVMTALTLIADSDYDERQSVLDDFEQRWKHDTLVMDKWFNVQAFSSRADTLDNVKRLMGHSLFSIKNPNKVRALIGAFCSGNPKHFHRADGSAYEFLIDNILQLDKLNPQIASRMTRLLSRWQRYDEGRQQLMKQQLQRLLEQENLSRDVYEIAEKSLK